MQHINQDFQLNEQKVQEKQSKNKISMKKNDQNQSSIAVNVESIFENLKIILQDLRIKQKQIQQYVQNEIKEMNQKLNFATNQLELVIELIQKQVLEENAQQSEINFQKQVILNSSKGQIQTQSLQNVNNKKLQSQFGQSIPQQSRFTMLIHNDKLKSKIDIQSNNFQNQNPQNLRKQINSNENQIKEHPKSAINLKGTIKNYFVESQYDQVNSQFQEQNIYQGINQIETNYSNNSQKNNNKNKQIFETEYFQVRQVCQNCQKEIESDSIQTPCFHIYHKQCLKELFKIQLQSYVFSKEIACICKQKLSQLFFQQNLNVNLEQLFQIQIFLIKNELKKKITQCQKCQFFWINGYQDRKTTICQICGQNGIIILQ